MVFSKSFPKTEEGSSYTTWEEVYLTVEQEKEEERRCRQENIDLMKECIDDAKEIILKQGMKLFDQNIIELATSLFEKRASHAVYFKEAKAKELFDAANKAKK
jgi:hypothetical protein